VLVPPAVRVGGAVVGVAVTVTIDADAMPTGISDDGSGNGKVDLGACGGPSGVVHVGGDAEVAAAASACPHACARASDCGCCLLLVASCLCACVLVSV
jgi:hypothetical protein